MGRPTVLGGLIALTFAMLLSAALAQAGERKLKAASYPGMTTFSCRTAAIEMYPGQNINDISLTKTCPNAEKVRGPGSSDIFGPGSSAEGYITRFKPSMVEIKPDGRLVTPSVWDLHLHHVVWISQGEGPTFASGEEKTIAKSPPGYGLRVGATEDWGINQMLHNLGSSKDRKVYITWEIDWVPEIPGGRDDIEPTRIKWLDVARGPDVPGAPRVYPVFDAERGFDRNGDGKYVFPDEVPTDPDEKGYEEREKISNAKQWTVGSGGATLVFGAGHLHPGGLNVGLKVARDGPDPGTVDGDIKEERRQLFRSDARYYEPAGAVSWDVSMEATRRSWRISLKQGDTVWINTTYDVRRASWYESMGILPLAWSESDDPKARDPFDDSAKVRDMYRQGGILTHGRLNENVDVKARKDLRLPDPRTLSSGPPVPESGIDIRSFLFLNGGFTAVRDFPRTLMRPPTIESGERVTFTNLDALPGEPQTQQAWHSITSCRAPCNRGSGIGYPLAAGPIKFDSGQLGYGQGFSGQVTTGSNRYTTPPLKDRPNTRGKGTTYSYFCRIHPLMRGSVRAKK